MLRASETVAVTDTGRQRPDNEDNWLARAPVFVVADGMGGAQAGEVASKIAVEAFERGLPDAGEPEDRLAERVREANQRIHELSRAGSKQAGMGTTITAAYVGADSLAIAHVGDSRAYLFRQGTLKRLTRDHTLVGALVEQGKLTEEEAAEHPQRSIITRALGPEAEVDVDTWSYPLRAGDVILLCSDGLTSMISEDEVGETLAAGDALDASARALIDRANAAGGRDNITVVLFRLEEVGADGTAEERTAVRPPSGAETKSAQTAQAPVSPPPSPPPEPRRARLARTQGRPDDATGQRSRRLRRPRWLAAVLAAVIVLALVLGGGFLATRQLYFLGTNSQGIVTIYRGLPYDLPAGIRLYESFYVSGVPAANLPADRRKALLDHHLRSQSDASNLVRDLELGKVSQ